MRFKRRDLLRYGGLGGGAGLLAGLIGTAGSQTATYGAKAGSPARTDEFDCTSDPSTNAYAQKYQPPSYLDATALDRAHTPPPFVPGQGQRTHEVDLTVIETTLEVANGTNMRVWAYGGSVPGPVLRASEGDRLRVTLANRTAAKHTIHFHGAHDVGQDGLDWSDPGASVTCEIEAGPFGLHPYHCHTPPYAWHLSKGMYGAMIVDPPGGRPAAHEFVLCLSGWDTDGDGRNEFYGWNGLSGYYQKFPLKVPAGELVRIYLVNMVEYDPVASFHLHAQTFDLYRSGTSTTPHEHTDVVTLGQTERAILEFRLPRRGRYMFHPHQTHMADRGAMGWIVAV
jgi:FtsP/CotA-like multicopper oxidase with cupredoxin domain